VPGSICNASYLQVLDLSYNFWTSWTNNFAFFNAAIFEPLEILSMGLYQRNALKPCVQWWLIQEPIPIWQWIWSTWIKGSYYQNLATMTFKGLEVTKRNLIIGVKENWKAIHWILTLLEIRDFAQILYSLERTACRLHWCLPLFSKPSTEAAKSSPLWDFISSFLPFRKRETVMEREGVILILELE
jgi:hypothetical protein